MPQFEPGSSLADWFTQRDEPWEQLVTMGPTGFESYARVRYLDEDRISQGVLYGRLRVYLAGETKTPGDCFHALWDGSVSSMYGDALRGMSPWFPAGVLSGPKLRIPPSLPIPARQYLLFRGPLEEIGHWGARELTTGSPKDDELPAPHLLWPGDHRWFIATDVDSDFTWVGGSEELIDAVIGTRNSRRSASTASERPPAHDGVSTRGAGPQRKVQRESVVPRGQRHERILSTVRSA